MEKPKIRLTKTSYRYIVKKEDELDICLSEAQKLEKEIKKVEKEYDLLQDKLIENKNKIQSILIVQEDIEKIIPLLDQAKNTVAQINQKQLEEIRKYNVPPEKVLMTLTAVFHLLDGRELEWKEIVSKLGHGNFITMVLDLDWNKVSSSTLMNIRKKYLSRKEWDLNKIKVASQAAGPLADWLESEITYIEMQKNIKPYREEMKLRNEERKRLLELSRKLNLKYNQLKDKRTELNEKIFELEEHIDNFFQKAREDFLSYENKLRGRTDRAVQCELVLREDINKSEFLDKMENGVITSVKSNKQLIYSNDNSSNIINKEEESFYDKLKDGFNLKNQNDEVNISLLRSQSFKIIDQMQNNDISNQYLNEKNDYQKDIFSERVDISDNNKKIDKINYSEKILNNLDENSENNNKYFFNTDKLQNETDNFCEISSKNEKDNNSEEKSAKSDFFLQNFNTNEKKLKNSCRTEDLKIHKTFDDDDNDNNEEEIKKNKNNNLISKLKEKNEIDKEKVLHEKSDPKKSARNQNKNKLLNKPSIRKKNKDSVIRKEKELKIKKTQISKKKTSSNKKKSENKNDEKIVKKKNSIPEKKKTVKKSSVNGEINLKNKIDTKLKFEIEADFCFEEKFKKKITANDNIFENKNNETIDNEKKKNQLLENFENYEKENPDQISKEEKFFKITNKNVNEEINKEEINSKFENSLKNKLQNNSININNYSEIISETINGKKQNKSNQIIINEDITNYDNNEVFKKHTNQNFTQEINIEDEKKEKRDIINNQNNLIEIVQNCVNENDDEENTAQKKHQYDKYQDNENIKKNVKVNDDKYEENDEKKKNIKIFKDNKDINEEVQMNGINYKNDTEKFEIHSETEHQKKIINSKDEENNEKLIDIKKTANINSDYGFEIENNIKVKKNKYITEEENKNIKSDENKEIEEFININDQKNKSVKEISIEKRFENEINKELFKNKINSQKDIDFYVSKENSIKKEEIFDLDKKTKKKQLANEERNEKLKNFEYSSKIKNLKSFCEFEKISKRNFLEKEKDCSDKKIQKVNSEKNLEEITNDKNEIDLEKKENIHKIYFSENLGKKNAKTKKTINLITNNLNEIEKIDKNNNLKFNQKNYNLNNINEEDVSKGHLYDEKEKKDFLFTNNNNNILFNSRSTSVSVLDQKNKPIFNNKFENNNDMISTVEISQPQFKYDLNKKKNEILIDEQFNQNLKSFNEKYIHNFNTTDTCIEELNNKDVCKNQKMNDFSKMANNIEDFKAVYEEHMIEINNNIYTIKLDNKINDCFKKDQSLENKKNNLKISEDKDLTVLNEKNIILKKDLNEIEAKKDATTKKNCLYNIENQVIEKKSKIITNKKQSLNMPQFLVTNSEDFYAKYETTVLERNENILTVIYPLKKEIKYRRLNKSLVIEKKNTFNLKMELNHVIRRRDDSLPNKFKYESVREENIIRVQKDFVFENLGRQNLNRKN